MFFANKASEVMEAEECYALLLTRPSNVFYFSRFPSPQGSYLLITRDGCATLITPALDFWRARAYVPKDVTVVPYLSKNYELPDVDFDGVEVLKDIAAYVVKAIGKCKLCIDSKYSEAYFALRDKVSVVDVGRRLAEVRAIKTSEELSFITKALRITEESMWRVFESIAPGVRESEVAGLLEGVMRSLGADGFAFNTIVASGPNSSYPHAVPTHREIKKGDVIVIDAGAKYAGYSSDMTRTVTLGQTSKEVKEVIDAVNEALNTAVDTIHDGVKAEEVDRAAREVLRRRGLSKYFIHGLGHGVGVDVHEAPRLASGSIDVLREGMVVTVEPGVYIPGKFGVRIENMVLVRKRGAEVLNKKPNVPILK